MKKKLKLHELEVQSFVTSVENESKGGVAITQPDCIDRVRSLLPTGPCLCTGMYPSLNMPCTTLDNDCPTLDGCFTNNLTHYCG